MRRVGISLFDAVLDLSRSLVSSRVALVTNPYVLRGLKRFNSRQEASLTRLTNMMTDMGVGVTGARGVKSPSGRPKLAWPKHAPYGHAPSVLSQHYRETDLGSKNIKAKPNSMPRLTVAQDRLTMHQYKCALLLQFV